MQNLVTTNVFLDLQTLHLELPENGQRQPAMLTVRRRYMYIIIEALLNTQNLESSSLRHFSMYSSPVGIGGTSVLVE